MLTVVHHAFRSLLRAPVFFGLSAVSLGAGIGLSSAILATTDTMLHPESPYRNVDRLYTVEWRRADLRSKPPSGDEMRAYASLPAVDAVAIATFAKAGLAEGHSVAGISMRYSPNYFDVVGIRLERGRFPSDDERRNSLAVVVSYRLWHSAFHDRATLDGAEVTINGQLLAVVGVLEKAAEQTGVAIWQPLPSAQEGESVHDNYTPIIVRLRAGATQEQAQAQFEKLAGDFHKTYSSPSRPAFQLVLKTLKRTRDERSGFEILLLIISFGIVAIAATNVAALSLTRGLSKTRDYALRLALGALPATIGVEVLTEIAIVCMAGALIGIIVAISVLGGLRSIIPEELTWLGLTIPTLTPQLFVYPAIGLGCSIIIAAALPVVHAIRIQPSGPLKDGAGTTTGRSMRHFRWLVMAEVAVAMVLMMMASLTTLSSHHIASFDFGFRAQGLYAARVSMANRAAMRSSAERIALRNNTFQMVRQSAGVSDAALSSEESIPGQQVLGDVTTGGIPGVKHRSFMNIGPGFFHAMGIPLVEGRDIIDGDRERGAIVLSEAAARALFPHGGAVGRSVKLGDERSAEPWIHVVGITRDVHLTFENSSDVPAPDTAIFASVADTSFTRWTIVTRSSGANPRMPLELQRHLRDMMPSGTAIDVLPWTNTVELAFKFQQFFARIFGFIGTAALILASTGLFSVLAYVVGQRTREFAVRIALGASTLHIAKIVMKSGFEMALGGTAIGAFLSFGASAGVSAFLYGVKNTDPSALLIAELTLLVVTMAASAAPALRATRADPLEIMRAS